MADVKIIERKYSGDATIPDMEVTSLDTTGMTATEIGGAWATYEARYTTVDEVNIDATPQGWSWWVWYYLYKMKSHLEERNGVVVRIWTLTAE